MLAKKATLSGNAMIRLSLIGQQGDSTSCIWSCTLQEKSLVSCLLHPSYPPHRPTAQNTTLNKCAVPLLLSSLSTIYYGSHKMLQRYQTLIISGLPTR